MMRVIASIVLLCAIMPFVVYFALLCGIIISRADSQVVCVNSEAQDSLGSLPRGWYCR